MRKSFLYTMYRNFQLNRELQQWNRSVGTLPFPARKKQGIVEAYARKFAVSTFVETGTWRGDMVHAMKDKFDRIYSIELDKALYERAKKRFSHVRHISIFQGDSSTILPTILSAISQPCLFWLDAHYSGGNTAKSQRDTPILEELSCILNHSSGNDVILIDDARMFDGLHDYPEIKEVETILHRKYPAWVLEVKDDIIRIHNKP